MKRKLWGEDMKRKLSDLQRKGDKVGEVKSHTDADKVYSIYAEGDNLSCDCIGFIMRKRCSHMDEFRYANEDWRPTGNNGEEIKQYNEDDPRGGDR